ncbi:MAG: hypothetical protein WBE48_09105 [Xanthobacteraceae bacterium]|jgi:hypothetical protein
MKSEEEPPSCLRPPIFMLGQDSRGRWVVEDNNGARGGLFVDREQALRYIRFENGNRPHAFVSVTGIFELNIAPPSAAVPQFTVDATRERRVA